ncbi:MAG: hypothetical protein FJZ58_07070 [Chlamydiae bacterium]|nr:hypothetical protein [Chlamydiota bacterium]
MTGVCGIYLYNDSPFILKAQVIAANGTKVGDKLLQPQQLSYVEDQLGMSDPVAKNFSGKRFQNYSTSMTPYKVYFYCVEGELYSNCKDVAAGATVMANACPGQYYCKPKKEEEKGSEDAYKQE